LNYGAVNGKKDRRFSLNINRFFKTMGYIH